MYSSENYLWGLSAYYLGVALVLLYLLNYRKLIPWRHLRNMLLVLIAALIVTPVKAYPDMAYLAPAWFVCAYAAIIGDSAEIVRTGVPLIIVPAASLLGYIALAVLLRWKKHRNPNSTAPSSTTE